MKQVQEDLLSFLAQGSGIEWNITNLLLEYVEKKTRYLNYNVDVISHRNVLYQWHGRQAM